MLLGLGDSIPGAAYCTGCTSFVQLYSNRIQADTGTPVEELNMGDNSGIDSTRLLSALRSDPAMRSAVRRADVITLSIGANDSIPDDFAYLQGRCGGPDNIECYLRSLAAFEQNERAILAEIRLLRGSAPTAIRVTTYYNPLVGNELSVRTFGQDFALSVARPLIERLDAAICREVARAHGICVDIYRAFNGPDGTRDAGSLLSGDHIHPSQEGHRLIAQLLATAGYEPLTTDRRSAAVGGGSSVVRR
jgi:lysophospholipase L1-like esterase